MQRVLQLTAKDLITDRDATRRGFISQALEKGQLFDAIVKKSRRLRDALIKESDIQKLSQRKDLRADLLAAVGVSAKAAGYLDDSDQVVIIEAVLDTLRAGSPKLWTNEVASRFLVTSGDSLGGSLRNLVGAKAKQAFINSVTAALKSTESSNLASGSSKHKALERSIQWQGRVMVFDRKPTFVGKNIDVILLKDEPGADMKALLETKSAYLACGEIKGGIDPAGADEHWKTASTALDRVRANFGNATPALFFAGVAIVQSMAEEIEAQLRNNRLTFAANMTKPVQIESLASWLVSL